MRKTLLMIAPLAMYLNASAFSVCAVGDSITEGGANFVAHRVALESSFAALGWNVEWKGSHVKSGSGSSNLCEGWSSQNAVTIAGKYEENAVGDKADVLLLHAGHNYNAGDTALTPAPMSEEAIITAVTNAHRRIIAAAREHNSEVIVLYAKVITSGGNRAVKYSYIPALNEAIAVNAAALDTAESPVIVVDMADGWNYAEDCVSDCVHPNASGAAKMAAKWIAAFSALAAAGKLPSDDVRSSVRLWKDGPCWADVNIGAGVPWDFGEYFWWGDAVGCRYDGGAWAATDGSSSDFQFVFGETSRQTCEKDVDTLRSEGWVAASGVLAPEHDAAHVKWGGNWRMPTDQEFRDLVGRCDWTWTATNGVNGFVVRGRGDYSASSIFLPAAGWGNDSIHNTNGIGYYWSSVPYLERYAYMLNISDRGNRALEQTARYYGFSVRPVRINPSTNGDVSWLDERAATTGRTGSWASPVAYGADGKSAIADNVFAPHSASTGNVVAVEFTARFDAVEGAGADCTGAQAAVRLGPGGCFQIYSNAGWTDVEAEGVTPESGAEYTMRFTFDYTKGVYSAEVRTGFTGFARLGVNPVNPVNNVRTSFPLAAAAKRVTSIGFMGGTFFTSLWGECKKVAKGFMMLVH